MVTEFKFLNGNPEDLWTEGYANAVHVFYDGEMLWERYRYCRTELVKVHSNECTAKLAHNRHHCFQGTRAVYHQEAY